MLAKSVAGGLALMLAQIVATTPTPTPDPIQSAFKDFVAKYGRTYENAQEEKARFAVFANNYRFIVSENAKNSSYTLEVNAFADQSPAEFQSKHLGLSVPTNGKLWKGLPHLGTHKYSGVKLSATIDWTTQGAVTHPKNQGQCGSCWAFSSTGSLEGAWQIATGKLISLSEQQLVDCSKQNMGCNGGSMDMAFSYLEAHVTCTEASYAYKEKGGTCSESSCTEGIPIGGITGYKDVDADDEKALMEAVMQQPVSIAIEADQSAFQLYSGGILSKTCGDKLDHGVLLVGYGSEDGKDYWKVKNSWGADWGEDGYIRLERGKSGAGECGIKSQPTYPVVDGSVGPSPGPSPSPPSPTPPSPTPGCTDKESFCTDTAAFDPSTDCELLYDSCKKTCHCCDASSPAYCSGPAAQTPASILV